MVYDFSIRHETHPTFLHPEGLPLDKKPHIPEWGLILPGPYTSEFELDALKKFVTNQDPENTTGILLPKAKQLTRIAINEYFGCWELPIYGDGNDVYPLGSSLAGKSRARYPSLMVKGVLRNPTDHGAHRVMYAIFRGRPENGMPIDHLCRNAKCCYHRHLEVVSVRENTKRIHEARMLGAGQTRFDF